MDIRDGFSAVTDAGVLRNSSSRISYSNLSPAGHSSRSSPQLPAWSDGQEAEVQLLEQGEEVPWDDSEKEFWVQLHRRTVALCLTTWATMPVTFGLAWVGYQFCVYAFILLKVFLESALQLLLARKVKEYLKANRPNSVETEALNRDEWTWTPAALELSKICVFVFTASKQVVLGILDLLEALDPDTDAMTPGNARGAFNEKEKARYRESWSEVPVAGSLMASFGLPGLLAISLLLVICWQLYIFEDQRRTNRGQILSPKNYGPFTGLNCYIGLFQLADAGNLSLLGSTFKSLWLALDVQTAEFGGVRLSRYPAVVPEFICSAWFTVSALAFTVEDGLGGVAPIAFSITTTFVTSIRKFYSMA